MVFPSRIDAWFVAVITVALAGTLYGGFAALRSGGEGAYGAFFAAGVILAILVALVLPCRYVLEQDHLFIRAGLLFRQRIPYLEITGVEPSSNPLAAPALSLRRVKVAYRDKYQLVSPRDRDEFMRALRARITTPPY